MPTARQAEGTTSSFSSSKSRCHPPIDGSVLKRAVLTGRLQARSLRHSTCDFDMSTSITFHIMSSRFPCCSCLFYPISSLHKSFHSIGKVLKYLLAMSPTFWAHRVSMFFLSTIPSLLWALPSLNPFDAATSLIQLPSTSYNSSVPSFNVSVGSADPVCDPTRAGRGLQRATCDRAYGLIPSGGREIRFSRRDSPATAYGVQVPRRYSSCT